MSEDRRSVNVAVRWVPVATDQPMPTHHWEARVAVADESVCNVRCYTREVALEEALGALTVAFPGWDF
jgi:hypothetical protein